MIACITACTGMVVNDTKYNTLLSVKGKLEIARYPPPMDFPRLAARGNLDSLPVYNPDAARLWQVDVRGCDLSGLGLGNLHAKSSTGKGVGIVIIDQALLVDHAEYRDRLKLYEESYLWKNSVAPMPLKNKKLT